MPCLIEAETLKVLPDACGSPASSALSEMPRLISFSLKTSSAALTRSSLSAWRLTACSPAQLIDALVPRKSNRWDSSLAVWLSALSTSCRSTLLTTSKEESAMGPTVLTRARPRSPVRPPPVPCILLHRRRHDRRTAGCPSGQRERSVKPPAQPTLVRTQHLPPPARQRCPPSSEPLSAPAAGALLCPATSDPHRPPPAVRGTFAERRHRPLYLPAARVRAAPTRAEGGEVVDLAPRAAHYTQRHPDPKSALRR